MTDQRTGDVYADVDTYLTQDHDGNITFCGECEGELYTLTLLATGQQGATIAYKLSYFGERSPCDANVSGSAQLYTTTNTIRGHGSGIQDDCSRVIASAILTRN